MPSILGNIDVHSVEVNKQTPGTSHIFASGSPPGSARIGSHIDMLAVLIVIKQRLGSFSKLSCPVPGALSRRQFSHLNDIRWLEIPDKSVYGILAAPPCTDFSVSGAQYWKQKDCQP